MESVVNGQRILIEESSRAHAEAVVQINRLEAEKIQLASELVAVIEQLTTRDAMGIDDVAFQEASVLPVCYTTFDIECIVLWFVISEQVGDYKRSVWLMSYGPVGPVLDPSKFQDYSGGHVKVDECYTTTDHDLKYTLVHLEQPVRETIFKRAVSVVSMRYGIKFNEIVGYAVVNGLGVSNELYDTPRFKVLLQHMVECNPSFSNSIKNQDIRRGGVMKRYTSQRPGQVFGIDDCNKVVCIVYVKCV